MNRKLVFWGRIHSEIHRKYTVYCQCGNTQVVAEMGEFDNYRQAERKLRDGYPEFGWLRVAGRGWCCPSCVDEIEKKAVQQ